MQVSLDQALAAAQNNKPSNTLGGAAAVRFADCGGPTLALVRLWTLQRACDNQRMQAGLGAASDISEKVAIKTMHDSFQFDAQFGAGQDVFDALRRRVDKLNPGYAQ